MATNLEIISPERRLLAKPVDMVVIPGTEGDLGILPDHAPLITSLRGGTIEIYEGQTVTDRFYVSGGFAEVTGTRCTILADDIINVVDLDPGQAQADLDMAQAAYDQTDVNDETAYRIASDRLIAAEGKLYATSHK